ncbi:MAG: SprT-like domain-containing protein [bacterium]
MKRDNHWLTEIMFELWENHFVDIPRKNHVVIKFGKRAKRQLGCIKWAEDPVKRKVATHVADDQRISQINITRYFEDDNIPEEVVIATIAHEMCHYAHGFNSPLQQQFNHPHKGGIIRKELIKRGLGEYYRISRKWLKLNWLNYLKTH